MREPRVSGIRSSVIHEDGGIKRALDQNKGNDSVSTRGLEKTSTGDSDI